MSTFVDVLSSFLPTKVDLTLFRLLGSDLRRANRLIDLQFLAGLGAVQRLGESRRGDVAKHFLERGLLAVDLVVFDEHELRAIPVGDVLEGNAASGIGAVTPDRAETTDGIVQPEHAKA